MPLRDAHGSLHSLVLDPAASFVIDDEVAANAIHADAPRSVIIDAHGAEERAQAHEGMG